ncbi:hypothetical protein OG242_30705 [Streptomyces sp. NBC_00727]
MTTHPADEIPSDGRAGADQVPGERRYPDLEPDYVPDAPPERARVVNVS